MLLLVVSLAVLAGALTIAVFASGPQQPNPAPAGLCAYPGPGDPVDAKNRPPTPANSGFPSGPGWKGGWVTTSDPLHDGYSYDFVWGSFWKDQAGNDDNAKAVGRAIIFRLGGNPDVIITAVTGHGSVAANGRSAYSCCDGGGQITVSLQVPVLASSKGTAGHLWGIDLLYGQRADFEITNT